MTSTANRLSLFQVFQTATASRGDNERDENRIFAATHSKCWIKHLCQLFARILLFFLSGAHRDRNQLVGKSDNDMTKVDVTWANSEQQKRT